MQSAGGAALLTPKQIATALGKSPDFVAKFTADLDHVGKGKGKMFFVGDIAEKLVRNKIPG